MSAFTRHVRDRAVPRPALTIEPGADPIGLSRAHLKALASAVQPLERQIKADRLASTRWGMQVTTLAADALGRLERRYGR